MEINLRSVAAVTSLGGGITSLRNICMHFDFLRPLAYQSYLKYLEEKLTQIKIKIALVMCKNGWALHFVINDRMQFYLMAKVLGVRTFNRPNNRPYANNIWV